MRLASVIKARMLVLRWICAGFSHMIEHITHWRFQHAVGISPVRLLNRIIGLLICHFFIFAIM